MLDPNGPNRRIRYQCRDLGASLAWSALPSRSPGESTRNPRRLLQPMLAELTQKLRQAFGFDENRIESVVYQIRQYADWVEIPETLQAVADDTDDNKFVECAVIGGANWIISGDRRLLALTEYQGIRIVNARDFLIELSSLERRESEQGDANGQDNPS